MPLMMSFENKQPEPDDGSVVFETFPKRNLNIDDTTNLRQLKWNLLVLGLNIVESTLWNCINLLNLTVITIGGVFLGLFQGLIVRVMRFLSVWYMSEIVLPPPSNPSNQNEQSPVHSTMLATINAKVSKFGDAKCVASSTINDPPMSAVNITTPHLLDHYRPNYQVLEKLLCEPRQKSEGKLGDIPVNLDVALFFNMLVSAVYESNAIHKSVFKGWGFDHQMRVLNESCSSTVVSKKFGDQIGLFVIFKGTSPFDLNEWMSDFSITKTNHIDEIKTDYNVVIPGNIHQGFYKAFFPSKDKKTVPMFQILSACQKLLKEAYDMDLFDAQSNADWSNVKLWVSGHSLGAALATCFTTFLVSPPTHQGKHNTFEGKLALHRLAACLTGVYTYGNPKCGDVVMATHVNTTLAGRGIPFYRFRNGNDIVGAVPLGNGFAKQVFLYLVKRSVQDQNKHSNDNPTSNNYLWNVNSVSDFSPIGVEYRVAYDGSVRILNPMEHTDDELIEGGLRKIMGHAAAKLYERVTTCAMNSAYSWVGLVKLPSMMLKSKNDTFDDNAPIAALNSESTLLRAVVAVLAPTAIGDHAPSEYARHIYMYKEQTEAANAAVIKKTA